MQCDTVVLDWLVCIDSVGLHHKCGISRTSLSLLICVAFAVASELDALMLADRLQSLRFRGRSILKAS